MQKIPSEKAFGFITNIQTTLPVKKIYIYPNNPSTVTKQKTEKPARYDLLDVLLHTAKNK